MNYRKFAWWNTQWAYAGVRSASAPPIAAGHDDGPWEFTGDTSAVSGQIKAIPDIPTTVMAEATASIAVVGATAPMPETAPLLDAAVRERWNDYGIGLLLQGDLKAAGGVPACDGARSSVCGRSGERGAGATAGG